MNIPLRARYFRLLVGLLAIACGAFLLLFGLYEWREHGGLNREGLEEILYLLGLMLVLAPFVLWAAWQISGQLLLPLRAVLGTAERIRAGNLRERIPTDGRSADELKRLSDALNDAFDRYAGAVTRLDRFSADASHQLRTPLAGVRATAEVCLQRVRTPEEYRDALGKILEEVDRLRVLVEQLLELARLEPGLLQQAERVDLRAALAEWAGDMAALAEARGVRLEGPPAGPPAPARAHPRLLREAFMNVLNNALAATPEGGVVRCSVEAQPGGWAGWSIEDSGPGIPPGERDRVRDRFYRGRSAAGRGSGLGLAIVQQIVELHGGRLEIGAGESLGGARLCMVWPA